MSSVKADPHRVSLFVFPHKAFRFMWLEVVQEVRSLSSRLC